MGFGAKVPYFKKLHATLRRVRVTNSSRNSRLSPPELGAGGLS
jgi:hypothetical protein